MTQMDLLDPTSERAPADRELAPRPASLEGRTVTLLDIAKRQSDLFLDRLEQRLRAQSVEVRRARKPTFAKPMPADLRAEVTRHSHAVIEALAD
jgi:hypothetical protein